jgi:predicted O-methyltransferase YrrM
MNAILEDIYAHRAVSDAQGKRLKLHSEISPDEGELLMSLIERHGYSRTLEIGCAFGLSSLFICEALSRQNSSAKHTIIDAFQQTEWDGIGLLNLKKAGYTCFELIEKLSEFALPDFVKEGRTFQFALIDGMHTFDHALVDFFYVDKLLEDGGTVLLDDLQLPAIKRLARYISNYPNYRVAATAKRSVFPPSLKRRLFELPLRLLAKILPRDYSGQIFSDSFFRPDVDINLISEMVAFQKIGPGTRGSHWYASF